MTGSRIGWRGRGVLLLVAAVCLPTERIQAQPPSTPEIERSAGATAGALTSVWVNSKIEELEAKRDIDPATRDRALALYRSALAHLETVAANNETAASFQDAIQSAPARTANIRQQLTVVKSAAAHPAKPVGRLPLEEVEQMLGAVQAEIATLKTELGQLEANLREMGSRPPNARAEQSAERQALEDLGQRNGGEALQDTPLVAEARRVAKIAERMARVAKINLLDQELISLPARQALATASRDLAAAKIESLERQLPAMEARVNSLRQNDAKQKQAEAEQASRQLSGQHPLLESYAKETAKLGQKLTELTRLNEESQPKLAAIDAEIARVKDNRIAAQQVLEIGSVGEFGVFLRGMREQLPAIPTLRRRIYEREQAIVDERIERLKVDESRRLVGDPAGAAQRIMAGEPKLDADLRPTLEKLIVGRREALDRLSDAHARRIDQLAKINAAERELLDQTSQLDVLLNARLVWLPSAAPLGLAWIEQLKSSLAWAGNAEGWKTTATVLTRRIAQAPILTGVVLSILCALWFFRGRLRQRLQAISCSVGRPATDNYVSTPEALTITALLALPWPLLFGYFGWLLTRPPEISEFAISVGTGLLAATAIALFLRVLQLLCAKGGVFRAHFDWSDRACRVLRRNLGWFMVVAIPAALVMGMIEVSKSQVHRDGLGRLAMFASAIALAYFAVRVANPRRGAFVEHLSSGSTLWATRGLWYPFLWVVPMALAVLAVSGYYDGAVKLQVRLLITLLLSSIILLAYGVATREVLVARRRLELQRAHERREKARAAAVAKEAAEPTGMSSPQLPDASEIDVASINQQTRTLLRMLTFVAFAAGFWLVWRQMLPALGALDEIAVWTQTISTETGAKTVPVTLANLLVGLAIAVTTLIAAHNLPGVLEITLLQRLSIQSGTRYAITAISRYSIVTIGLIIAFGRIGADWSQLQWIVAALGVGVGFGLQEIVANFVSGLIILFERPVRVGDTVTIGDLSGKVSRIQIRATSIIDWDNREILVPNKSLITEKVTNWTLSDAVTRVMLKVGIAYGSDTATAQKVMLEAVNGTPQVLAEPPPSVLFLGFGESSLDYEIRAFVGHPSHRLSVLHDLHVAIERTLREHKIEIPFPQRDLHLRERDAADVAEQIEQSLGKLGGQRGARFAR